MTEHYPRRICTQEVEDDDKSVQCDFAIDGFTLNVQKLIIKNMKN